MGFCGLVVEDGMILWFGVEMIEMGGWVMF